MKMKRFYFPAFSQKNQKYKRNPPRPPPFFGRLWRGITVFWHCEGGHKNQFRTPLEHFSKRDFFARWARNTRRGGSGGGSAPPAKRYATPENSKFSAVAEIDFGVYFPAFWRGQFRERTWQNRIPVLRPRSSISTTVVVELGAEGLRLPVATGSAAGRDRQTQTPLRPRKRGAPSQEGGPAEAPASASR